MGMHPVPVIPGIAGKAVPRVEELTQYNAPETATANSTAASISTVMHPSARRSETFSLVSR